MNSVNIDALYVGSLRIKILHVLLSNCTFYKRCVTKVVHCKVCFLAIGANAFYLLTKVPHI